MKKFKLTVLCGLGLILTIVIILYPGFFRYQEFRNLATNMTEEDFTKDMEPVDLDNIPIINSQVAKNLGDKKLGEISSLGSMVTIGEFTLQKVDNHLYYVAPLEYRGFFQWFKNQNGTSGYIKVNATKEDDVQLVTEINGKPLQLKYLDSAWFGSNLERHAFFQNPFSGRTSYTFEIDDDGNPYWTVSIFKRTIGISGEKVTGTMLIDAQTGETKQYSVEDTPSWVDIIQPMNFVQNNINNWGKLIHGPFNFSNTDEMKLTEGMRTIYDGENCYYYAGLTSVGEDESLSGFALTNTRTNETRIYKTSGAIEVAAQKSAQEVAAYKPAGYSATFPILINIQGTPTYFMSMLDGKGLIKGYAFVNVLHYNIVGHGNTVQQAYDSYIEELSNRNTTLINNSETVSVEGKIERIGMFISGESTYYMLNLEGNSKNYIVPTEVAKDICIAEKGDHIKISYIDNSSDSITVKEFTNLKDK